MTPTGRAAKPKTVDAAVRAAATKLRKAGVVFAHGTTDPRAEAAFLLGEVIGFPPDDYAAHARAPLTPAQALRFDELVAARIETRKPAAYLVNRMYMFGLPFHVDERVIVPRSFIGELLASHFGEGGLIGDPQQVTRVLDLCTGSGCLAILAAYAFPNAQVDAADLSEDALDVATQNVALHQLEARVTLHCGDLYEAIGDARYDLIISNPPYVDAQGMASLPPECRVEPAMAFDGGADGLDLVRGIVEGAAAHLTARGGLLCEIGRGRAQTEAVWPRLPFLWLDTEASEGEVFWLERDGLIK